MRARRLTRGQWWLSSVAALLMAGLAGLAFRGMFGAVRDEMVPFFGPLAWIVPVGIDLGIVVLILTGILLEWLAMPMPALRLVAAFFMAATMWLNALAARGQVAGVVGHLALPVLFIASVEAIRHAVRRRSGLAAGAVREGIPLARWVLAPLSSWAINRRMILWRENSYARALEREQLRRRAIARLRAVHGKDWRDLADSSVVWQLRHGIDVEGAAAIALAPPAAPPEPPPERQQPRQRAPRASARGSGDRARAARVAQRKPDLPVADQARLAGVSARTMSRARSELAREAARHGLHSVGE